MILRRKVFLAIVVVANALLWAIPSNVVELVARDKHTLLGRFSREHFAWIVAAAIITVVGLYVDWAKPEHYKKRWFQVIATLMFLVPSLVIIDYFARSQDRDHYVRDSVAYHRPADGTFTKEYIDKPNAARTFPNASGSYGTVECVYHSDSRGYRNRDEREQYDIVVLGDSFAEGSNVSDDQAWPAVLGEISGATVYNLGMSGYSPVHYAAALEEHGLGLSPKVVVCMLYEGNDFRGSVLKRADAGPSFGDRLKRYQKQSPIINGLDRLLIGALGPIGSDAELPELDILSWLPLRVPDGPAAKYYAFAPKQLLQNKRSATVFRMNPAWQAVSGLLSKMHLRCEQAGAEFVVTFAPTKAHVVLPIARDRLPADKVQAFAGLRSDGLPPPDRFMEMLFENLSATESVVRDWCAKNDVTYVALTGPLRDAASVGRQVYYTYDQHWTPDGHEVVAGVLGDVWRDEASSEWADPAGADIGEEPLPAAFLGRNDGGR
jgi:hypothetical protein